MAYVSQDKKAKIAAALKPVVPAGWKYTLSVHNHSMIVMTVRSAPVDAIEMCNRGSEYPTTGYFSVNHYHFERHLPDLAETLAPIFAALNTDNHDRSDIQTDYFDVGHYVDLRFGQFGKPFVCTA